MEARKEPLGPDVWGGLSASLVALPSALAYGVSIYAVLGPAWSGAGALSGLIGAALLGLIAPLSGGAPRLVTAPCAPAAAVMGALAADLTAKGLTPDRVVGLMALTALFSAAFQLVYGALRGGRLIKFIPYPVVTGYLSGVAVIIFLSQLPKLLGIHGGPDLARGLLAPASWNVPGLVVGLAAMAAMVLGPRLTARLPSPILGLAGGLAAYGTLAAFHPELRLLEHNKLVVGPLAGAGALSVSDLLARWRAALPPSIDDLRLILTPALTLSVLLSMDTLKTCVVVDALTRSRHDSDKTLLGQGGANLMTALAGGVPGAGTMGATLVNVSGGGLTLRSGVLCGAFSLLAFMALGRLVAWVPVPALAGILLVVAARMYDRKSLRLLRQRSTIVDFSVGAAVIVVAVLSGLIAAAGVGLGLSILLFIHDQISTSVIRRKSDGTTMFSKRRRLPDEREALERLGAKTVVCELQGNLFFGTTDQLFSELEKDLPKAAFVILDLRRVTSVDFTATHMLKQIEDHLHEHGGSLILCSPPKNLPSGFDTEKYFDEVGLVKASRNVEVLPDLDDALARAEDGLLSEAGLGARGDEAPLALGGMDLLKGFSPEQTAALEKAATTASFKAGQAVFKGSEVGDQLFFLRRGQVRIDLPLAGGRTYHVVTFGRGDFFGEVVFLDRGKRSADAVAVVDSDFFVLSRADFDRLARENADLGVRVFARLAKTLAVRLRQTDAEVRMLQES
ncbi:MAG: SLC26A/SulP transporter family protein [Elusimicrobia bacterium]|nr:SLC26A/SulP transporter family protein [Elusimicrobiota bacterium]